MVHFPRSTDRPLLRFFVTDDRSGDRKAYYYSFIDRDVVAAPPARTIFGATSTVQPALAMILCLFSSYQAEDYSDLVADDGETKALIAMLRPVRSLPSPV